MGDLTEHFDRAELACRCGCDEMRFDPSFLAELERLRVAYDRPMVIPSGYRCPEHNAKVSKTGKTGPHTRGAVDVGTHGRDAWLLIGYAVNRGWTVGVSQKGARESRFIHLDRLPNAPGQPRPWVWSY